MRILYFHQHFSTPKGATGIRSYEMARKLTAQGHQVTMVCGSYSGGNTGLTMPFVNGQRRGTVDNIDIIEFEIDYANAQSLLKRTLVFAKFAYKSIKIALKHDYDLAFATTTPLTAALPGLAARWLKRKTFIFEVRDLWPELPKAMGVITNPLVLFAMSSLERLAYRSAHGHIGLSPGIVTGIKQHIAQDKNIALIPNGCDLDIFAQSLDEWQPEGINSDDFVAVFSGTHGQANGLHAIINAAEMTLKQAPQIKFLLVGQGKLKPELMRLANDKKLSNIIFLAPINKALLAKLFNRADVGLQVLANIPAFYHGTSPNKFFDYIAAGLPVINNYPGWLAEAITEHQCGIAVEPDNTPALVDALIKLSTQESLCKQMGKNARKLAKQQFSRQQLAQQFVDYIEQVHANND
ncbi:glycosyltransferase family 4 protein [Thalassotalea sediminis]|uniref:glycosyltransferase family 4 protein n=1 Tax=Thalassotalea sediminis TaxID=1759089 RepID=UPI0025741D1D|nr:glycosyltransferase family 4 protein [Thalassotalea sediminis]